MPNETPRKLNLDEIFDDAQALEVLHEGMSYRLPRLKTLPPKKLHQFQELGKKAYQLQDLRKGEITEEQTQRVESLLDEMLMILCAALPVKPLTVWQKILAFLHIKKFLRPLSFNEKMRVVTFYTQDGQVKKALQGVPSQTGRRHSAA